MNWLAAYCFATALNLALFVFMVKWRRRALFAETELAARAVLDKTPANFGPRERPTK